MSAEQELLYQQQNFPINQPYGALPEYGPTAQPQVVVNDPNYISNAAPVFADEDDKRMYTADKLLLISGFCFVLPWFGGLFLLFNKDLKHRLYGSLCLACILFYGMLSTMITFFTVL